MNRPLLSIILVVFLFSLPIFAKDEAGDKNPAANKIGKGTEPVHFDDRTLMFTPTPSPTPIVKQSKEDIDSWYYLRETKSIIEKSKIDLIRYEKLIRKEMDSNLLSMKKVIASMHTGENPFYAAS